MKDNKKKELNPEQLQKKISELEIENNQKTLELEKMKEIASKSQSQYVSLKYDFDSYISRIEKEKATLQESIFIKSIKNVLPFVEELRKSLESVSDEIKDNSSIKWLNIMYEKFIKKLGEMWVFLFDSIGEEPNHDFHEPLGFEQTEEANKWKIVREYEKWFIYKKWDTQTVIKPAKVIVWN